MSTQISATCQATLTKIQPEWDEYIHDIETEIALGTPHIRLSLPNTYLPILLGTLALPKNKQIVLIAHPSEISPKTTELWGAPYALTDTLTQQELDGTVTTQLARAYHAFLSGTAGRFYISQTILEEYAPSREAYTAHSLSLATGQSLVLSSLASSLTRMGYTRHTHNLADTGFMIQGDEVFITHTAGAEPIQLSFFGNRLEKIVIKEGRRTRTQGHITLQPILFPKETDTIKNTLQHCIVITKDTLDNVDACISITTVHDTPNIALPEHIAHIEMPSVARQKQTSTPKSSSPISQERALELIGKLTVGKPAVHTDHGIGIFEGLERRTLHGSTQEYLILRYKDGDMLAVPVSYAHKVSPYIGDSSPTLYRLGGTLWSKTKRKAQHDAAAFAKELMILNKQREQAKRSPYVLDEALEERMHSSFEFELTPDQVTTWDDVKNDLEKDFPMDRLIVGDVGFGKTELAMRAARHAVANGKQVAILAPTTLLVQQHVDTFKERLSDIADSIFLLSRFSTTSEVARAKKTLSENKPAIIIGTHAILGSKVPWTNLGMLIIDEEQRFGVKQKEHLKKMRTSLDILSLSATPIPRTLSMALSGLRALSVIATAPKGRKNIATTIQKASDDVLKKYLVQELQRNGQIYIVAPKIRQLGMIYETVKALVPSARTAIAHAQLSDETLSSIIHDFDTHNIDILISSSIVENGLDLPNANTMVVWNAPHFGLAQLYQLRGRIGRRSRQGYALFLYSQDKLTGIQRQRLAALTEASRIGLPAGRQGSGWEIARHDLEMRGAGNMLGAEQSGSATDVGMYLYLDMVNDVSQEERADIHNMLPAFIPTSYIADSDERSTWYLRLSRSRTNKQLQAYMQQLAENFGEVPEEAHNLARMIMLEKNATQQGIERIRTKTIAPNDEDPYMRIECTSKNPLKTLEQLSNIKNTDGSPARWQVREYTLFWDVDEITPELIDQLIASLAE